jgi:hypothetical protein
MVDAAGQRTRFVRLRMAADLGEHYRVERPGHSAYRVERRV